MRTVSLGSFTRKWADHILTYGAEGSVLLGTVAVYKLAAMRFGDDGFNIYAVVRRTTSFIVPFAIMGLTVAVMRYVAMMPTEEERVSVLRSAGLLVLGVGSLLLAATIAAPDMIGFWIFGDHAHSMYAIPIGAMVLGQLMHALLYSYWRGAKKYGVANFLQVVNLAIVPMAAFAWGEELADVLLFTASCWMAFTVIPFLYFLVTVRIDPGSGSGLGTLLRYGIPRLPGDLALAALFTLPVYAVNHVQGVSAGGQIAFGLTLLNMVGALFGPISVLMLTSVAHALSKGEHGAVIKEVTKTRNFALLIGLVLLVVFQLLAGPVLDWYMGGATEASIRSTRILFIGSVFYAVFIALRSSLDAYFVHAQNSVNLLIALACCIAGISIYAFILPEYEVLLATVPLSFLVLAVLTWRDVHKILRQLHEK